MRSRASIDHAPRRDQRRPSSAGTLPRYSSSCSIIEWIILHLRIQRAPRIEEKKAQRFGTPSIAQRCEFDDRVTIDPVEMFQLLIGAGIPDLVESLQFGSGWQSVSGGE